MGLILTPAAEEGTHYVYHLRDPADDYPFYVGKGKGDRMYRHVEDAKRNPERKNKHKNRKILKVLREGREIEHVIVFETDSLQEANEYEIREIARWRILIGEKLTNLTEGGRSESLTQEVRERLSVTGRRNAIAPDYANPMQGRRHSVESRRKMSESSMGQIAWNTGKKMGPLSEEHRRKMSLALKGRKMSEPFCKNLSRVKQELYKDKNNHPWTGRKHSEETKRKIREARIRYWRERKARESEAVNV